MLKQLTLFKQGVRVPEARFAHALAIQLVERLVLLYVAQAALAVANPHRPLELIVQFVFHANISLYNSL